LPELLALIEGLRAGSDREQAMALSLLEEQLKARTQITPLIFVGGATAAVWM